MRSDRQVISRFLAIGMAVSVLFSIGGVLAATKTPTADLSGAVPRNYTAVPAVQTGMIVRLKATDTMTVEPLLAKDFAQMLGVTVPNGASAIVLSPAEATAQQVLVATSGRYSVLVSNQAGTIKAGDYITISALAGIGMKAGSGDPQVVGRAVGTFSGTRNVIGSVKLKTLRGNETTVALGRVAVDLGISRNPTLSDKTTDNVPGFLSKAASGIASKPVATGRVYLAAAVLLVVSFITGTLLYSGVRNGIVAVGRNPLSKKSIIRSLIQTIIAGLIVFVAGVFAVYLLLKL